MLQVSFLFVKLIFLLNLDGETPNSLVKMLSFKHCNLFPLNTNCFETFLFVGTHGGNVFIHALHHHQMDQRREEIASEECCPLIKEIRMQHQAPIIAIECLQFGHTVRLIIISEEQIRSFILPTLKPSNIKYRFTAVEGSRIKKAVLVQLTSRGYTKIKLKIYSRCFQLGEFEILKNFWPSQRTEAKYF